MRYTIVHKTAYHYTDTVSLCYNLARLQPRTTGRQICRDSRVTIRPKPDELSHYEDFFGNRVIYFSIEKQHHALTVEVVSEVEKEPSAVPPFPVQDSVTVQAAQEALLLPAADSDLRQYVFETPMTAWSPEIAAYAARSLAKDRSLFEATSDLMQRIFEDFDFEPGFTTISTPLTQVMASRKGVCQDFAHLAIACLRSQGLAARYVSGYIETISPEGKEKLVGADASHAWFSVYIAPFGWVDFDPTNNILPDGQHITIGWGRDYADIAPFKGVIISSGGHELQVFVDVIRER